MQRLYDARDFHYRDQNEALFLVADIVMKASS